MNTIRDTLFSLKKSNYLLNESTEILNNFVVENKDVNQKTKNSINFVINIIKLANYCLKDETEQINFDLKTSEEVLPWEFEFNEKEKRIECIIKNDFGHEKLIELIFHIGDAIEMYRTTKIRFKVPKCCSAAKIQIQKVLKN